MLTFMQYSTTVMEKLSLPLIEKYIFGGKKIKIDKKHFDKFSSSFSFLEEFSKDKIIYGINTGFGPMVQMRIEPDQLNNLQYNLVRSHSTGLGPAIGEPYAKAVVLARLNNFVQGNSGISDGVVLQLEALSLIHISEPTRRS